MNGCYWIEESQSIRSPHVSQETKEETCESTAAASGIKETALPAFNSIETQIRRAEAAIRKAESTKVRSNSPSQLLSKWAGL